jgi:2'-5' RNA ligase
MHTVEKIRTFIAIKISPELENELRLFLEELKKIRCNVKWVNAKSIHLTLKFLGNLSKQEIEKVTDAVKKGAQNYSNFKLITGEKGAFPSLKRPRVFWVGLAENDHQTIIPLQKEIDNQLSNLGFEKESRRFHPHLTMGRLRSPKNIAEVTQRFKEYRFPEIEFIVNQILVMKSELTSKGSIYSVQNTIPLK